MHCNASFLHRSAGNSAQVLSVSAVVFLRDILEANLKKKSSQTNKQTTPNKKKQSKTKQKQNKAKQKNSQLEAKGKRIYFSSDYTTYFYSVFYFKF